MPFLSALTLLSDVWSISGVQAVVDVDCDQTEDPLSQIGQDLTVIFLVFVLFFVVFSTFSFLIVEKARKETILSGFKNLFVIAHDAGVAQPLLNESHESLEFVGRSKVRGEKKNQMKGELC